MATIGDLCDIQEKRIKFEWKIKDFLQLTNTYYLSPIISFYGMSIKISIVPNGMRLENTFGWIDFLIIPTSNRTSMTLDYSFHLKTVDGKLDAQTGRTGTGDFEGTQGDFIQCIKLISRSDLLERKSELLPSGILTIICTLKENDAVSVDENDRVDEFTQTEGETGVQWRSQGVGKLQEHFKEILMNGNFSDVVLKVNGKEFKSHRNVLARSPVFLAMMTHDTKEKNTGVVDIQDVDADTFSDFLRYLYTESEKIIISENVVELFTAADKYQVDELKESCRDYMLKNISVVNFCDILSLSLIHVEKDLIDACSQFFIENSLAIVKTPKWIEFVAKNPVASTELHIKQIENKHGNKIKN